MEGNLTWCGEHTKQYTDYVLQNSIPETYIILLTNVSPINSMKTLKMEKKQVRKTKQKLIIFN